VACITAEQGRKLNYQPHGHIEVCTAANSLVAWNFSGALWFSWFKDITLCFVVIIAHLLIPLFFSPLFTPQSRHYFLLYLPNTTHFLVIIHSALLPSVSRVTTPTPCPKVIGQTMKGYYFHLSTNSEVPKKSLNFHGGKSFNRTQSRAVTGLLTGRNTLRRHLHLMGLSDSPLCRRHGAQDETSAHILYECEALASLRHAYLVSSFLEPEDIKSVSGGHLELR
jgi:hypothetical protein